LRTQIREPCFSYSYQVSSRASFKIILVAIIVLALSGQSLAESDSAVTEIAYGKEKKVELDKIIKLTGKSSDNIRVSEVEIAVRDLSSDKWLGADGWQKKVAWDSAKIVKRNKNKQRSRSVASWQWRWGADQVKPEVGTYQIRVRATDPAGNQGLSTQTIKVVAQLDEEPQEDKKKPDPVKEPGSKSDSEGSGQDDTAKSDQNSKPEKPRSKHQKQGSDRSGDQKERKERPEPEPQQKEDEESLEAPSLDSLDE
jgi:hypothetical protein